MVSDMSSLLAPSCTSRDCLVKDAGHPIRYGTQRGSDAGAYVTTDCITSFFGSRAGVGRRAECVSSIDGQPVDIVFLLSLPASLPGEQLNALAAVARMLRDPTAIRNLRRAPDTASFYRATAVQ